MRHAGLSALMLGLVMATAAPAMAQGACQGLEKEADVTACAAAIAAETDPGKKVDLLFDRAYARVDAYDYDGALSDLSQLLAIDPDHARAYHEQAYLFSEMSEYQKAEDALDVEQRLTPDASQVYTERSYARFFLADLPGAFEDADTWVRLAPDSSQALIARGRLHAWLGRFREARLDFGAAETFANTNPDNADVESSVPRDEQDLLVPLSRVTQGGDAAAICAKAAEDFVFDGPNIIGDCTEAFLAATDTRKRASYLFARSNAWLVRGEGDAATIDMRFMTGLEPNDAGWKSNLGYRYLQIRHSWAAEREFDRALAIKRDYPSLAGRASAHYQQGELDEAFADAKASFDIEPNPTALIVLGDLAMKRGKDKASAKLYWMGAYHLGSRDDGLITRLKNIGVTDPASEPASEPAK